MASISNKELVAGDPVNARPAQNRLVGIIGTATLLALLYFGREVLIPITLAVILSLLIAPFVHGLRRLGLGQTAAVWLAVLALMLSLSAIATVIGTQIIRMGSSLPQYESTIRGKLNTLDQLTLGKLSVITEAAARLLDRVPENKDSVAPAQPPAPGAQAAVPPAPATAVRPIPVEVHQPPAQAYQVLSRILASVWSPLESAAIVIVVLVFILLEHEGLRDRFIRLAGGADLRATTVAVNDAGERLSRFFAYQFAVNLAVGVMILVGLMLLGHSQALLWATVAALLRFVPYVGIWIAAFCATLFAAAVAPGWSLAIMTLSLFCVVEFVVSQLVEPFLYGHTTGLSPLSVVIAAIFWSWIWGPVGLVVSTPLTLCLVVAGRYVKALNMLEILLGEVPALTLPENFYQRALSGDAETVIARARVFLKRKSLAAYCDAVLMPALHLARQDLLSGSIGKADQLKFRGAIAAVIEALGAPRQWWKRQQPISLLADVNLGRQLRDRRERLYGRWQGALEVPAGSVVLCLGVGSLFNELAAEILVRVLTAQRIDSRHLLLEDLPAPLPCGAMREKVSAICLVSLEPAKERERIEALSGELRARMPQAKTLALILQGPFEDCEGRDQPIEGLDLTTHSYEETAKSCQAVLDAGSR
jgi:predicted PurR-regulated permease PerM